MGGGTKRVKVRCEFNLLYGMHVIEPQEDSKLLAVYEPQTSGKQALKKEA